MNTLYETENLHLRVCDRAAAPLIAGFYERNFEDFALYEPLTKEALRASFHRRTTAYEKRLFESDKYIRMYMFEKHNPMIIIGTVSYRNIDYGQGSCVVGYKMDRHYRRRGYCREAILRGNRIMKEELGLDWVEATVLPDNIPSIRLLESMGFENRGLLEEGVVIGNVSKRHLLMVLKL